MGTKTQRQSAARRHRFVVELTAPASATDGQVRYYVEEAVSGWKGQFLADDPLIHIGGVTVKDFARVLGAEKKKAGAVLLRQGAEEMLDAVSAIMHGTRYGRLMREEHKQAVRDVVRAPC